MGDDHEIRLEEAPGGDRLRAWPFSRRRPSADRTISRRRHERMAALVAELRARTAQVAVGGGEASIERHRSRGKLPARERVDRLSTRTRRSSS